MMTENTVRLRSKIRQIYDNKSLLPGDKFPFPVPERVAKGLIAHHYAELDESEVVQKVVRSEPESEPEHKDEVQAVPRRGRYSRRDLRAEDGSSKVVDSTTNPDPTETP